jgi:hypothetical protein
MLNRIVSASSLLAALISIVLFVSAGYWLMVGRIGEMEGIFALTGWLLAAGLFSYRSSDPAWLEPLSIVKAV